MDFFEQIECMKNNDNPFVLYGFNDNSALWRMTHLLGIDCSFVIDDATSLDGVKSRYGQIVSWERFKRENDICSFNYLICINFCMTIRNKLENNGISSERIAWFNDGLFRGINDVSFMVNHYMDFKDNLELFADEESKHQYWNICLFRMDYSVNRLKQILIEPKKQYFNTLMPHNKEEIYIDFGAFDGKSVVDFINYSNGKYKKIAVVEPNKQNMKRTKERLKQFHDIDYYLAAAYDTSDKLISFDNCQGKSSKVQEKDSMRGEAVRTISIDDIVDSLGGVTYVKADVEGAESRLLSGGVDSIRKYRPKLAICIYHSSEDMLYLPRQLTNVCEGYKMYFRHHREGIYESVCYLVPN